MGTNVLSNANNFHCPAIQYCCRAKPLCSPNYRLHWWLANRTRNMNKKSSLLLLGLYVNLFCTNRAIRIDELYPFVYISGHNIAKGSLKSYLENEQSAGGYWCITAHSHCIFNFAASSIW